MRRRLRLAPRANDTHCQRRRRYFIGYRKRLLLGEQPYLPYDTMSDGWTGSVRCFVAGALSEGNAPAQAHQEYLLVCRLAR